MVAETALNILDDKLLYRPMPTEGPGDTRNPYPAYAQAREEHPVQRVDGRFGQEGPPLFFVFRHADVVAVLLDNKTFSSKITHDFMAPFMGEYVLPGMDEPAHARYRALLAPSLRPKMLARWESAVIENIAAALIDAMAPRGKAELVAEFNFAYPAQVIAHIIGVPQKDFTQFQRWAVDIVGGIGDPAAGVAASQALRAYLAPFIEARRQAPQDDFISELLKAEIGGDRLNDEEIQSFLLTLLPAGVETTFRSLGSLMFNLLTHPEQLEALRLDRSLVAAAIDENLRVDAPFQTVPRLAVRDTQIRDVKIPAGAIVVAVIGSANHDPELIADPDRFDIRRPLIRNVTFGHGVHTCMGLHLAKLETRVALNFLLDRLPGLRFDHDAATAHDVCIRGKLFRSPTAVPVRWDV